MLPPDANHAFRDCTRDLETLMANTDELGGFQFLEVRSTLPDELLMYSDKLSMAHGLEARVPFLDREIVEWVERLDASFKIRRFSRKWLHRRVCETALPQTILHRRKRNFGMYVVDDWFRKSGESVMNEMLSDPSSLMYRYLRHQTVSGLLRDHVAGHQDNHKLLFSLVVFEQWLRLQDAPTATALSLRRAAESR
jgi:asparagine synthase (glutamine-hydrolysing)